MITLLHDLSLSEIPKNSIILQVKTHPKKLSFDIVPAFSVLIATKTLPRHNPL
jgi:hypothetical protein